MSSPRVEQDTIFPLRRNALGYRFRAPKGEMRHRLQLLTAVLITSGLILALTL